MFCTLLIIIGGTFDSFWVGGVPIISSSDGSLHLFDVDNGGAFGPAVHPRLRRCFRRCRRSPASGGLVCGSLDSELVT